MPSQILVESSCQQREALDTPTLQGREPRCSQEPGSNPRLHPRAAGALAVSWGRGFTPGAPSPGPSCARPPPPPSRPVRRPSWSSCPSSVRRPTASPCASPRGAAPPSTAGGRRSSTAKVGLGGGPGPRPWVGESPGEAQRHSDAVGSRLGLCIPLSIPPALAQPLAGRSALTSPP